MQSVTAELALVEIFAEESEDERTFYGFSDNEISDLCDKNSGMGDEDEGQHELFPKEQKATSGTHTFRLRVALRPSRYSQQSTDEDEEEAEEEEQPRAKKRGAMRTDNTSQAKRMRRVKFEDKHKGTAVDQRAPSEQRGSDSAEDVADSFLAKREQNIKANKAMLAQLMADLQKMPGGAGFLKKQADKQKTKERSSRPPRSGGEFRKNPERASRRQTRSMGGGEDSSALKEEQLELSLEEELLEVRRAPQRRGGPRPNQSKPHVIRPVEDITEDEIQLVADNMTDKVYNRVTGSTCHQCRQKTVDTKTCCRSEDCRGIQGQFCGPCLRNRYGEDVKKALLDPEWKCPPCRGICNCSFCRQRDGRCPTGILFPLAQYHGFSDVHSYLSSLQNKLKNEDNDVEM
uniref:cell division cycle-associated protein 7-like n=1 Tax=Scatophagus argus TaxID=75038 RepID=UPI001ED7E077|nr:cell division cycle-associated protein 7-like [Scatophagus argus]XP_046239220.1 cell division cycle-associated protein 7-like [Scatophagus argus]